MAKNDSSKTVLIIVAVILGILLIGGLIIGGTCYWLYKVGTKEETQPTGTPLSIKDWQNYENNRYGFSIMYPGTFTPQESQNGDGVTLTSSAPAITIRAYGSLNSQNQTLDEYLNTVRDDLFKGVESAEETSATDATLSGTSAQERRWQYINSVDGGQTVMDQVTALKGDTFYTAQMVIGYSDYSEYAPMFDEMLKSYTFQ